MIEIGRLLAFVALCLVNWAPTESLAQDDGAALLLYPYVRVDTARNIDTTIQMSDISMLGNGSEVLADCYYLSSDRHCDRSGAICATDAQCAAAESCDATFVAERFPLRFFLSAPVTWSAAQGGTPVVLPANPIPAVPEDPFTGSLICVRYGSALNLLQGEATIGRYDAVDGALDIAKYNAVGLPAAPSAEGGDDTLVLGGAMEEYGNCGFSNTVQHLFDGADSLTTPGRQVFTTLALLPCEVDFVAESFASGTVNYTVTDELEQQYSLTEPLALPLARRLSDIDPSIFSFAMIGSLTGQTSIQSDTVGFAVVAIQEEVDPNSPSVAHSAALDTHRRGFKFEEDRIRLGEPGAEPTLTATATLTSTSVPTATLPPTASPTSTPTPVVVCGNGVIELGEDCEPGAGDPDDCCTASCAFEPAATECELDDQSCTREQCVTGGICAVVTTEEDGAGCNDQNACTAGDVCADGICAGTTISCDDGVDCTSDSCEAALGCEHVATEEHPGCPGACTDGVNNDPAGDDSIDSEDSGCATLAALQRFAIVSTADRGRRLLSLGGNVVVDSVGGVADAPYPSGASRAGLCGHIVDIRGGTDVGLMAVEGNSVFGQGETGERDISIRSEYASDNSAERVGAKPPFVGAGVCSHDSLVECTHAGECGANLNACVGRLLLTDLANANVDRSGSADNFLRCRAALTQAAPLGAAIASASANVVGYAAGDRASIRTRAASPSLQINLASGVQILEIEQLKLQGKTTLILQGQADTTVIFRVKRALKLGGSARIELGGGLTADRVLWNVEGSRGGAPRLGPLAELVGTVLAPERRRIQLGSSARVVGALIAPRVEIRRDSVITHRPFLGLMP